VRRGKMAAEKTLPTLKIIVWGLDRKIAVSYNGVVSYDSVGKFFVMEWQLRGDGSGSRRKATWIPVDQISSLTVEEELNGDL